MSRFLTQPAVSVVEEREAAARSSLVEAFYGDDSRLQRNTALVHIAAEHTRAALRVATPLETPLRADSNQHNPGEDESLFKWLGIVEPPLPTLPVGGDRPGRVEEGNVGDDEPSWELPFANYEIEQPALDVIPAPSSLWTPWPTGRLAPNRPGNRRRKHAAVPDPPTRVLSAVEMFGSLPIQREVQFWVAGTDARQMQLRKLMVRSSSICTLRWSSAHFNCLSVLDAP